MQKVIQKDSNCIDVGAHKGEILSQMLKLAPKGHHFAFEPIPEMAKKLQLQFADNVTIFEKALSDNDGEMSFQWVKNAPAYSGLKRRKYDTLNPDIEEIKVQVTALDHVIPSEIPVHFIKIDVEGGEFGVLKGAEDILKRDKPYVVFECGLGASDYYNTKPEEVYDFVQSIDLQISTLNNFVKNRESLSKDDFCFCYLNNTEYYFILHSAKEK